MIVQTFLFWAFAVSLLGSAWTGGVWFGLYLGEEFDRRSPNHIVHVGRRDPEEPWRTISLIMSTIAVVFFVGYLVAIFYPAEGLIEHANQIRSQATAIGALN